jgi:hypothetical protein
MIRLIVVIAEENTVLFFSKKCQKVKSEGWRRKKTQLGCSLQRGDPRQGPTATPPWMRMMQIHGDPTCKKMPPFFPSENPSVLWVLARFPSRPKSPLATGVAKPPSQRFNNEVHSRRRRVSDMESSES